MKNQNKTGLKNFKPKINLNHNIYTTEKISHESLKSPLSNKSPLVLPLSTTFSDKFWQKFPQLFSNWLNDHNTLFPYLQYYQS